MLKSWIKKKREEVNKILESENSGYRLSESNEFIPITDDISIKSINAVSESPFNYAKIISINLLHI